MSASSSRSRHWLWPFLLALGIGVICLAWATLATMYDRQMGWMILIGAVEICWMLSLGGLAAGRMRITLALLATLAIFVIANGLIGAMLTGQLMGTGLAESITRIGPSLMVSYALLRNGIEELALLGIALLLAWRLAR